MKTRLNRELDWRDRRQALGLLIIPLVLSLVLIPFSQLTGQAQWLEDGTHYYEDFAATQDGAQYNHLADSLLAGKVTLDLPKSEILLSMENPYDTPLRTELNAEAQEPIFWDYAFYDGEYYCYFGVLPCILTFLPVKALTGLNLRTDIAVVFFAILVVWSIFFMLKQLQCAFFRKMTISGFVVGLLITYTACGVFEQAFFPRLYPLPILSGYLFSTCCLTAWFKAKRISIETGRISKAYLAIGAACAGCTLGCRPQFILVCLLALPLFWAEIRNRRFFSLKGIGNTLSVILPILIVAVPFLYYNYIRFGSITDFGAAYNLTGADMTSYQFDPYTIFVRSLEYLFMPFTSSSAGFPYIEAVNNRGIAILMTNEPFFAGFVFLNPCMLLVFCLLSKRARTLINGHGKLLCFTLSCAVIALADIVIASYVSGVNMRYFADFSLYLILPCLICFWAYLAKDRENGSAHQPIVPVMALLALLGACMYSLTFFSPERFGALVSSSPHVYHLFELLFG